MIKKTLTLILALMMIAVIVGCSAPSDQEASRITQEPTTSEGVSEDVDEVDSLSEDLDTSDLDDIDQDLDEINW